MPGPVIPKYHSRTPLLPWDYKVRLASAFVISELCFVVEAPCCRPPTSCGGCKQGIGNTGHVPCVYSCVILCGAVSLYQLKQHESLLIRSPSEADFDYTDPKQTRYSS